MLRPVRNTYTAQIIDLDGSPVWQAIPLPGLEQVSPFILLHHFNRHFAPGEVVFGVPAHPHRGFSPVTYLFDGAVEHHDSLGNSAVIHDNEVQWINAGRGLIHSEKITRDFAEKGGHYQGVQLWINVPAAKKMSSPEYLPITAGEMVLMEKDGVTMRLVSGAYGEHCGPAPSSVFSAMLRMKSGSNFRIPFPDTNHVLLYVLEGEVNANDTINGRHQLIAFEAVAGDIELHCSSEAKLLLLAGEPIDEPMVKQGPYVMNTQTEILEAMRDYAQGRMGFLY